MNKSVYYLISDIHLERKNEYKKQFLLDAIDAQIQNNNNVGIKTTIIFAGDIDNGDKAYEWMSKINAEIIYVAGNHEFWEGDYYETLETLKKSPKHVHFLHNDFVEIGDYIFIGSTMWTDVGKTLNPSLLSRANGKINDNFSITAKEWYKNSKNKSDLTALMGESYVEKSIEKNEWNVLVEQEENQKSLDFFNQFATVYGYLKKFMDVYNNANIELKMDFYPLTQDKYNKIQELNNKDNYSYRQWLSVCFENDILRYGDILKSDIDNITQSDEKIFKKLSKMDLAKEVIMVSHHLPFLEERLVGSYSPREDEKELYNQKADNVIYAIRDGVDSYPQYNYFYRISKGEFSKDESILAAIHYSNNGAVNLPSSFLDTVTTWCHGHDHELNFHDYVKGIPIVTNPLSYSLNVFLFSEKGVFLNDVYKSYHNINTEEKEKSKVEKLRSLVLKEIVINKNEQTDDMLQLWIFSLMDFDKVKSLMTNLTLGCKKLFTYLAKNPEFCLDEVSDSQHKKIMDMFFSNHYYYETLKKYLDQLDLAYAMRYDKNFSYSNRFNGLYEKKMTEYFLSDRFDFSSGVDFTEKMDGMTYGFVTDSLFNNLFYLNKGIKRIKHLEPIINQFKDKTCVTDFFNVTIPDLYPKSKTNRLVMMNELRQKKNKLLDRYITDEIRKKIEDKDKQGYGSMDLDF